MQSQRIDEYILNCVKWKGETKLCKNKKVGTCQNDVIQRGKSCVGNTSIRSNQCKNNCKCILVKCSPRVRGIIGEMGLIVIKPNIIFKSFINERPIVLK
ncbi:hypothetical protein PPL_10778 [Heterostelium album PN500]|uniref:Uncharacterized protein n=1 Tax=Heterostelium pallidum (strain ATCC 26659 / Pp 5 / PN500) TaxID=670386 RepID=D3BRY8_HETP5|nr:hypothetical protein PPL_10778 [Heterostelium album PN500]EFA75725.1 hypothetical protein PPL_10778 [Heterostelium album PN500]|eukprot:XP_020427859.1 hypothetical protein PPL_10778 [Heterostelium album PN500]